MENKLLEKEIEGFLDRYPCRRTANTYKHLLKTFFMQNGKRDLEYPIYYQPSRGGGTRPMCVPIMEEAWKMSNYAGSLKAHAIVRVLWTTGVRNATFRALKYGSVATKELMFQEYNFKKEIEEGKKNLAVIVYPEMKKDVPDACKNRIPYFVFTPKETTEALRNYLDERERRNGRIDDDEFLFPSDSRGFSQDERVNKPMTSGALIKVVRGAARRAGLKNWERVTPHSLRKTFNQILKDQPENSRLPLEDKEFFMGHIMGGSREAYYDRTKVEKMREKFSKQIFTPGTSSEGELAEKLAKVFGIDYELVKNEAEKRNNRKPTQDEVITVLGEFIKKNGKKEQKIINLSELADYIKKGWLYLNHLPDGTAIVYRDA